METQNASNTALIQKKYKCVIIGDSGVGKSSFLTRLIHEKFDEKYKVNDN